MKGKQLEERRGGKKGTRNICEKSIGSGKDKSDKGKKKRQFACIDDFVSLDPFMGLWKNIKNTHTYNIYIYILYVFVKRERDKASLERELTYPRFYSLPRH